MTGHPGNVAITGAAGLLGSAVFREMALSGRNAVGLSRSQRLPGPEGLWQKIDLEDVTALSSSLDALAPHCIVHCAALTDVDWCETHPQEAHEFNAGVTGHLADWCGRHGARLIYISTDSVFDGCTGGYTEHDVPQPINHYARSKLAGEAQAIRAPDSLVVRTNLYGWNVGGKKRLCEWALGRLQDGQSVPGFADVFISPLSTPDLARYISALVDLPARGLLHLASADAVSKYELLRLFAHGLGYPAASVEAVSAASVAFAAPRPMNTVLHSTRFAGLALGATPTVQDAMTRFTQAGVPAETRTIEISGVHQ